MGAKLEKTSEYYSDSCHVTISAAHMGESDAFMAKKYPRRFKLYGKMYKENHSPCYGHEYKDGKLHFSYRLNRQPCTK